MARLLHRLTEKTNKFVWSEDCQVAFDTLKGKLVEAPILAYPSPDVQFKLDTDASGFGIGAVISQVQDGQERSLHMAVAA